MAFKNYNNNQQDNKPTINTYTPISFSNGESKIQPSRLSISYFNKLMVISIALRNNAGSNDNYATYDNDNQISVYVSYMKAKILHDAIIALHNDPDKHNVCVELKNGLLKVSDGIEYGSTAPCISISFADQDGHTNEVIYQTKSEGYMAAYNYSDGEFTSMNFDSIELDTLTMVLNEYYKAASYAIAASVRESNMYFTKFVSDNLKAIVEKIGAQTGGGARSNFNNKTFLSGGGSNGSNSQASASSYNGTMNGIPKGYEASSFEDIANSMN